MASIKNSCPIDGREILTEDILKGPMKATIVVISKTYLFVSALSILAQSVILTSIKGLLLSAHRGYVLGREGKERFQIGLVIFSTNS
jgi:hypothetical protein